MRVRARDLRRRLVVKFVGEEGVDYGGVAKEWFSLVSREVLNPAYGLFEYCREDIYVLQINADSAINPTHLSYFQFVGRVLGMALFHGHLLHAAFTIPFYKGLLKHQMGVDDVAPVDPQLHTSLRWLLENVLDPLHPLIHNTFTVEHEAFGQMQTIELTPGGTNIPVTEANKAEYVRYLNMISLGLRSAYVQGVSKVP